MAASGFSPFSSTAPPRSRLTKSLSRRPRKLSARCSVGRKTLAPVGETSFESRNPFPGDMLLPPIPNTLVWLIVNRTGGLLSFVCCICRNVVSNGQEIVFVVLKYPHKLELIRFDFKWILREEKIKTKLECLKFEKSKIEVEWKSFQFDFKLN